MGARIVTGLPIAVMTENARSGRADDNFRLLEAIEALGFWGVSLPDHILHPGESLTGHGGAANAGWRYADPFALLGYLAAATRRVRIMPRVLVIPYRQPFATAHALATIDSLSGGRLVFCPGVGSDEQEFSAMGIALSRRGRITDEYLDIIFGLWNGRPMSYEGEFYRFGDVSLVNEVLQKPRPPVWVGGNSDAALARAVRIADCWTPSCYRYANVGLSAADLRETAARANRARSAAGKPPLDFAVSSSPPLTFLAKSERAQTLRREQVECFTCRGTVDELRTEFLAYKEAGATDYVVNFPPASVEQFLAGARLFMGEIAPGLT
jgi:probable F420-dependent oxidoreductase